VIHNLKNAFDLGAVGVLVRCGKCIHERVFAPGYALRVFGGEAEFPAIARRLKCSKCGARPTLTRARWKLRARGSSWPQEIVPKDWGRLP